MCFLFPLLLSFIFFSKDKISVQPRMSLNSWDIRALATTPVLFPVFG